MIDKLKLLSWRSFSSLFCERFALLQGEQFSGSGETQKPCSKYFTKIKDSLLHYQRCVDKHIKYGCLNIFQAVL